MTQVPFTGGSGDLIDNSLRLAGFAKAKVFISNVVHCHPPLNRKSHDYEIVNCCSYLHRELEIVRPRLVITLSRDAERVLKFFFPGARILPWPFGAPRGRRPKDAPYVLHAKHPSWIKRQHDAVLETEYVSSLAAAVTWSFGDAARAATSNGSSDEGVR